MFDAEQMPQSGPMDHDPIGGDGTGRRQYTLKGVEAETINMMRDAARKDGMKIGAWVSSRMREAAFRSLNDEVQTDGDGNVSTAVVEPQLLKMIEALYDHKVESDRRLEAIQVELHAITSGQRTIMAKMLQGA
jgi:hypothetical protein